MEARTGEQKPFLSSSTTSRSGFHISFTLLFLQREAGLRVRLCEGGGRERCPKRDQLLGTEREQCGPPLRTVHGECEDTN